MMSSLNRKKDRYRQRYEIFYDMLRVSLKPINKTRIMASCYISYAQLKKYLDELNDLGLIGNTGSKRHNEVIFKTTEKGVDYLRTFDKLRNMTNISKIKNKNEEKELLAS